MPLTVKKVALVAAMLVLVAAFVLPSPAAAAAPEDAWQPPEEGARTMFQKGDRAFGVGSQSGGAGGTQVTSNLRPAPGNPPIANARCAMDASGCSGVCISYLNYYCSLDVCGSFHFCD